jgi:acyl carrier protein
VAANDLLAVVGQILEIPLDRVTDDVGPATSGQWTSLKHIQLVAAVEDAYDVRLTPREIRSIRTVGQLRGILASKGVVT